MPGRKRDFPGRSLETDYSRRVSDFMELVNKEYLRILRKVLFENQNGFVANSGNLVAIFFKAREKIKSSKLFSRTLKSITDVFNRVEGQVVKTIIDAYDAKKFPIPDIVLEESSQELEKSIRRNVELISRIADKQSENLERAVMDAVKSGANPDSIIEEVQRQANNGKAYAEFVARDQIGKAFADISREKQTSVGLEKYEWVATNDDRTRTSHLAEDGKVHSWDNPPLIDGRHVHPGEDYNCRCIAVPYFD